MKNVSAKISLIAYAIDGFNDNSDAAMTEAAIELRKIAQSIEDAALEPLAQTGLASQRMTSLA